MANEKAMRESSIGKLLLTMSLPVIIVMVVQVFYNVADVYFIGKTGDAMQIAAISLCSPVFSAISAFNTLIGFGGCTAVSIALGEKRFDMVRRYSSFVVYSALILGLILTAAILLGMPYLLPFLGTNEETADFAKAYLQILALGAPLTILGGALGNTVRADGDSKNAVIASLSGTFTNIALDPLFISGFHWGVRGAAFATVIGNVVSLVLLLRAVSKKEGFSLTIKDFSLRPEISLRVLGLGLPMAAGTMLMGFSHAFGNRLTVTYGNDVVAARSVAGKAGMLIPMLIMGICIGVQPAISYNFGAKNKKRLRQIVFGVGLVAVCVGSVLALLCFLFRREIVMAFINDASIADIGEKMMLGTIVGAPLFGVYQMCSTYLQGTGKVSYATTTSLLRQGIVYIPVLYAMEALFGLTGIIFCQPVTDVISTVVALIFCKIWNRQMNQTPLTKTVAETL